MGKLTDILGSDGHDELTRVFNNVDAAPELGPIPLGDYIAHITRKEVTTSRVKQTPSVKLTFTIIEGDFANRCVWYDIWLTRNWMTYAKRDLAKIGINSLEEIDPPLSDLFRCSVRVVVHRDDDGNETNQVKKFDVVEVEEPEPEPFAPGGESAELDDTPF